jgi:hypothetical protein
MCYCGGAIQCQWRLNALELFKVVFELPCITQMVVFTDIQPFLSDYSYK